MTRQQTHVNHMCVGSPLCLFVFQKKTHKNHTRSQTKDNPTVFFSSQNFPISPTNLSVSEEVRSSVERYDPSTGHWEVRWATMGKDGVFFFGGGVTPWKINMEPQNDGLEDDFPFQFGDFLVPC